MAIVRELLIRLGFQTNKQAINQTNRAITGFKTRFAIAATAVSYAFNKVTSFFGDIATATLDSYELARALGISVREFESLKQSVAQFRINDQQFAAISQQTYKLLQDFKQGTGALAEIARGLRFEIDPNENASQLLDKILKGLREIEDEQQRIRISANIYGDTLGVKVSDLAKGFDQFKSVATQLNETLKDPPIKALQDYERAVVALSAAWNQFVLTLADKVFPHLTTLVNYFTLLVGLYDSLFRFDQEGLKNFFSSGSKLLDPFFEATGLDKVAGFFKNIGSGVIGNAINNDIQRASQSNEIRALSFAGPSPIITNNIDIQVPVGTDQEQAAYISQEVERSVKTAINNSWIEIQNNNPVVE